MMVMTTTTAGGGGGGGGGHYVALNCFSGCPPPDHRKVRYYGITVSLYHYF